MSESTREATLPSTRCICTAYGRAFMMRSWARRSFDAATIFIALVICCVFLTARIRRRRSINDGICPRPLNAELAKTAKKNSIFACSAAFAFLGCGGLSRAEVAREFLDRAVQHRLQLLVELLLLGNRAEQLRVPRFDKAIQLGLERPRVRDGNIVHEPVGAGVDDRDLPFD